MSNYKYKVAECDVPSERCGALEAYRDKRCQWVSWIGTDEHHAIWSTIQAMVWREVAFKTIASFGAEISNPLNNSLLAEMLLEGHVATQVLAIRRLVDARTDVISLRRLVDDVKRNYKLLTRENYVCFDGLPYDYEAARQNWLKNNAGNLRQDLSWFSVDAHEDDSASECAHKQFDILSGIDPKCRNRDDHLPASLIETIERWIDESGAENLKKWSHKYLAHAGDPRSRKEVADLRVTANNIGEVIRVVARATEAISRLLLNADGRSNALMPVEQFDIFENLDKAILEAGKADAAFDLWKNLGRERDGYLNGGKRSCYAS